MDIAAILVLAAVGLFYISRTGNSGSVSNLELMFRQWLEDTLYVLNEERERILNRLSVLRFSTLCHGY